MWLIDIKKAFDSIDRDQLFDLLKLSNFDPTTSEVLKAMYKTETSRLILNGKPYEPFEIWKGVR